MLNGFGCQLRTQRTDWDAKSRPYHVVVLGRAEGFHAITVRACACYVANLRASHF